MITTLNNCNVVITGGLRKMTREKAYALIRAEGGFPRKKVSSKTDYLIVSDEQMKCRHYTEKEITAEHLDIPIMSEADFYNIIGA